MKSPTERIADAARVMRDAVGELIESRSVQLLSDAYLVASAVSAGLALRTAEAALIELGAEVEARSQGRRSEAQRTS